MRTTLLLLVAAALAGALLFPRVATSSPTDDTELANNMERLEQSVRQLRRSLRDAANDPASLEHLTELQSAIVACKALQPSMTESLPEAERGAFVVAFRLEMATMLLHAIEVEMAILAGDREKVDEAFAAIRESEDPGHERFTSDG